MKIGCVIVTYNVGEQIINTFNSIYNQVDKIIFVDNNSDTITQEILKKLVGKNENCQVVFNEKNEGIAKAINIGIKKLLFEGIDFILTLDHDSIASENMIIEMLNVYEELKYINKVGILSPAIYDINKKDYLTYVNSNTFQIITEPIQSGSLISKELINNIGYFNERLYIYYVDTEFAYKANLKGYKNIQCNKSILYHEEGKKTKHKLAGKIIYYNNYSEFAIYYRARNNVYMLIKYWIYFSSKDRLIKDLILITFFDNKKILKLKYHFKGIFDGLKFLISKET